MQAAWICVPPPTHTHGGLASQLPESVDTYFVLQLPKDNKYTINACTRCLRWVGGAQPCLLAPQVPYDKARAHMLCLRNHGSIANAVDS